MNRKETSDAIDGLGWSLVLGAIYADEPVSSLAQAG